MTKSDPVEYKHAIGDYVRIKSSICGPDDYKLFSISSRFTNGRGKNFYYIAPLSDKSLVSDAAFSENTLINPAKDPLQYTLGDVVLLGSSFEIAECCYGSTEQMKQRAGTVGVITKILENADIAQGYEIDNDKQNIYDDFCIAKKLGTKEIEKHYSANKHTQRIIAEMAIVQKLLNYKDKHDPFYRKSGYEVVIEQETLNSTVEYFSGKETCRLGQVLFTTKEIAERARKTIAEELLFISLK